jgi:pyruvate dehydrogenase E1 component alpha subunit
MHNSMGQEGAIVGACIALRADDYITGTHRSHGHPIGKGAEVAPLMAELLGRQTGVCGGKGGSMHLADFSIGSLGESGIVGASIPTATGAALSARLRGTDQVSLSFFGDGAANCGPFHESLNLAAIWKLPIVFFCENNTYAICSAWQQTTAVEDIACRAASYNMPGVIVDGQDVVAVYESVSVAVARARAGQGPSLVEAKTYRYNDHQDDFKFPPYRSDEEIASWMKRDPIGMFSNQLLRTGLFTVAEIDAVRSATEAEIEAALSFAEVSPVPDDSALLTDVYR